MQTSIRCSVSHYSAIGDTISCDAPYSAIGFKGKVFLRYPPFKACLWVAIGHFHGKKCANTTETQCDRGRGTGVSRYGWYFRSGR